MEWVWVSRNSLVWAVVFFIAIGARAAEVFHVASFNLENYLLKATENRPAKSAEARAKIRETLRAIRAEVVGLQEVGGPEALRELQSELKAEGLVYPYSEMVGGTDTNIHLAVLSQFPITARRPHTNDSFLLFGRRFWISRGFLEVEIQVNTNYSFTLINAHLKSRLPIPAADEAQLREQEAIVLRGIAAQRLEENPNLNLVVLGDFNDTKSSPAMRALLGGRNALIDTRPAERNGDEAVETRARTAQRNVTWTYYYAADDSYGRIDYVLISRGMAREWREDETYVFTGANWGVASDHRPVIAGFLVPQN
jgi:endonuclease/exonuclease/phosphatase family metal-dependent hydrolase